MRATTATLFVLIVGLAATAPASARPAVYAGLVTKGEPVVVTADAGATQLRTLVIGTVLACADGSWVPVNGELYSGAPAGLPGQPSPLTMSLNEGGRFAGRYTTSVPSARETLALTIDVAGSLTARGARGSFTADAIITGSDGAPLTTCSSGTIGFIANRRPGVIFGGATTQSEPLYVQLNRRTHRMTYFTFSWSASCTSHAYRHWELDGWHAVLRTSLGGSFARTFERNMADPDGHTATFSYGVSGRVRQLTAKGSLWARLVVRDTDDEPMETCASGPLAWKALSG